MGYMEMIPCACGCGQMRTRFDKRGREWKYIKGHRSVEIRRQRYYGWSAVVCDYCGKEFNKKKCEIKRNEHHFCKPECSQKFKTGENHPMWEGGITEHGYPLGFRDEDFKQSIRDRDGNKCRMCGKTEEENGRKLDVHHVNYDKEDLEDFNLISLCRNCHVRTNTNREYWWQELYDIQAMFYLCEGVKV